MSARASPGSKAACVMSRTKAMNNNRRILKYASAFRICSHYRTPNGGREFGAWMTKTAAGSGCEVWSVCDRYRFLKSTRCTVRLPSSALSSSSLNSRKTRRPFKRQRREHDVVAFAVFVRPGRADARPERILVLAFAFALFDHEDFVGRFFIVTHDSTPCGTVRK